MQYHSENLCRGLRNCVKHYDAEFWMFIGDVEVGL